jgi:hypothetical protein
VTGGPYSWSAGPGSIEGVYVAARCEGYDTAVVSGVTIASSGTQVRDVLVSKRPQGAKRGDGPSNKEMKQTKPAMARMARSSLLISVFDGRFGP